MLLCSLRALFRRIGVVGKHRIHKGIQTRGFTCGSIHMSAKWSIIIVLAIVVAIIVVAVLSNYVFINTKASVVDPESYLGNRTNAADIYGLPGKEIFYSPLNARVAPMDKLLLVNFEDHHIFGDQEH